MTLVAEVGAGAIQRGEEPPIADFGLAIGIVGSLAVWGVVAWWLIA